MGQLDSPRQVVDVIHVCQANVFSAETAYVFITFDVKPKNRYVGNCAGLMLVILR